MEHFGNVA